MKSEFMVAITQLAAEKNLPRETVLATVEEAIASSYRKDLFPTNENVSVKIDPNAGNVRVYIRKTVVETVVDPACDIPVAEAQRLKKDIQPGETVELEVTPPNAGRIAAQKAKQFILRRLHEAEHQSIYEEFAGKAGTIVNGVVQRVEPGLVHVDIGRVEALLPENEQIRNKQYRGGQRLKLYLMEPARTMRGSQILVSHAHPNLLRKLLEVEIPEIYNGNVEIKGVAREAGFRSKVAVVARQEGIDPVGSCVGLRGIRIQNIVSELNGEKIDIVQWVPLATDFIANALSPAQVVGVEIKDGENTAVVSVPEKQLSLAIGKDGQNARLAARLTGYRIDIKAAGAPAVKKPVDEEKKPAEAKAEVAEKPGEVVEKLQAAVVGATTPQKAKEKVAGVVAKAEEVVAAVPEEILPEPEPAAPAVEEGPPEVSIEEVVASIANFEKAAARPGARFGPVLGQSGIRFAEDILMPNRTRTGKKRKTLIKGDEAKGGKAKKGKEAVPGAADEESG